MPDLLHIRLLGSPRLTLGGAPITFRRRKSLALFAYLVLTGRPAGRETLAALFADDATEQLALQSLRNSVAELREHLGDHLILSRRVIAFDNAAPHRVDVHEFQRQLAAAAPDDARALAAATELYIDDLLAGFVLRGASGFAAWLAAERLHMRDLALRAWYAQLEAHIAAGDVAAGLAVAERLIAASPTAELTYRKAMELLAAQGAPEQAIALYERCRAALAEHLGVTPLPETMALYERIRGGATTLVRVATPTAGGGTVRSAELDVLVERLSAPECRLITLLAPSPAEATALALRAVTHYLAPGNTPGPHPFPDGVFMTAPADQQQPAASLSHSLELTLRQRLPEAALHANGESAALLAVLSKRKMLLVLDGLTPTDDEAKFVASILRQAPGVKLLVAARERLRLEEEWILDIAEVGPVTL